MGTFQMRWASAAVSRAQAPTFTDVSVDPSARARAAGHDTATTSEIATAPIDQRFMSPPSFELREESAIPPPPR
jgi:hypothetical protein